MRLSMLASTFTYFKGLTLHKIARFGHLCHRNCSVLRLINFHYSIRIQVLVILCLQNPLPIHQAAAVLDAL